MNFSQFWLSVLASFIGGIIVELALYLLGR
jgi:hypothetical protein